MDQYLCTRVSACRDPTDGSNAKLAQATTPAQRHHLGTGFWGTATLFQTASARAAGPAANVAQAMSSRHGTSPFLAVPSWAVSFSNPQEQVGCRGRYRPAYRGCWIGFLHEPLIQQVGPAANVWCR
jgi:hypothetical protein